MKQKEFRIIEDNNNSTLERYYPQVKVGWWIFSKWMRIARHPSKEFGLYEHLSYPHTKEECYKVVSDYTSFKKPKISVYETYKIEI